ncbi:hypothetical protein AVA65_07445 [Salmonella enterica subsp. enterica serovar Minnesota]|nr:hypothetical protein [Salmonella enterica subsp. enterica serovar Minnesota]
MKSLQTLRDIVLDNFERSMAIPQLAKMHEIMSLSLLKQPILSFDEGYDAFCAQIAQEAETYDAWMVTIYDIAAAMGDFSQAIEELNAFNTNFKSSLNAGKQIGYKFEATNLPFVIAFAYRITLALLAENKPQPEGNAA